ncbi:hypothetical protein [Pontibacter sp. BAB1700]|uniref:DUF7663 domain-containing protein n=1 Tax=Pontibacter sp. BAB1700 TaxID=1144253 RepID=UPI00026BD133|nr:hypothetical protein [Pontibacter sp. BAB1700]EJF11932.1 hypothetical protein O71_00265 [Pontibacter sp. BAB1700]
MHKQREILKNCFRSASNLWNNFLDKNEDLNVLYYPSAGEDLRPFVFTRKKSLDYIGINTTGSYVEPDLFIFSDYFPFSESRFFDSKTLHWDMYTSIMIDDYCELQPNAEFFNYAFNQSYVAFSPSQATGKAIFFRARVTSHISKEPQYKYAIYFFYENINLIDQLFIRNKLQISHIVWKRDGSGLGGGKFRHDFILPISATLQAKYYFIWNFYLDGDNPQVTNETLQTLGFPDLVENYITTPFTLSFKKLGQLRWEIDDVMNFYLREEQKVENLAPSTRVETDQVDVQGS